MTVLHDNNFMQGDNLTLYVMNNVKILKILYLMFIIIKIDSKKHPKPSFWKF